jgi:hypothetical protein
MERVLTSELYVIFGILRYLEDLVVDAQIMSRYYLKAQNLIACTGMFVQYRV